MKNRGLARMAVVPLLAAWLAGCSLLPRNEPVVIHRFRLELPPTGERVAAEAAAPRLLLLARSARAELATPRMLYQQRDHEIAYFARSRWVNEPARMLGDALAEELLTTGGFADVVRPGAAVAADLRLELELLDFRQDFRSSPSVYRVALRARLVDMRNGELLGTRNFEAEAVAPGDDPYGGVQAANQAVGGLLPQLRDFVLAHARRDPGG